MINNNNNNNNNNKDTNGINGVKNKLLAVNCHCQHM